MITPPDAESPNMSDDAARRPLRSPFVRRRRDLATITTIADPLSRDYAAADSIDTDLRRPYANTPFATSNA